MDRAFEMNLFSSQRLNLVKLSHPMTEVIMTRILVLQIFTGYFFSFVSIYSWMVSKHILYTSNLMCFLLVNLYRPTL